MTLERSAVAFRSQAIWLHRCIPEWWLGVIAAACWLLLLISLSLSDVGDAGRTSPTHSFASDVMTVTMHGTDTQHSSHLHEQSLGGSLSHWALMWGAMMLPLTVPGFRHVVFSSFRFRQLRAGVIFVGVYGFIWMWFGVVVILAWTLARPLAPRSVSDLALVIVLLIAAMWQLTAVKRRAINACGVTIPLRPFGIQADATCAQFGILQGWECLKSCWALMFIMPIVGHTNLLWMLGISSIMFVERFARSRHRVRQVTAVALGLVALSASVLPRM